MIQNKKKKFRKYFTYYEISNQHRKFSQFHLPEVTYFFLKQNIF